MNTATDIDAIAANADETIKALSRYRSEGSGECFRQYREVVANIASANGKPVDHQTLSRILQFAEKSAETLREDVNRAVLIAQARAAEVESKRIESECAPLAEEFRRLEAEFIEIERAWTAKAEDLRFQTDRLRAPLKRFANISQQLRSAEADRPASLITSWGDQVTELTKERLRIQHALSEPSGPEVKAAQIQAWRDSEKRRAERLESIDAWLAVYRRAHELIREKYLCQVTGLWDPAGDPATCLDAAHKEIMERKAARLAEVRAASIAVEMAEEAADMSESDSDEPGSISTLFASALETVA